MGNIIDYARTETRSFETLPFRAADALVLAQLSYDDVPECVPTLDELYARYSTFARRVQSFSFRRPIASLRTLRFAPFHGVTIAHADDELHHDRAVPDHDVESVGLIDPQITHDFYRAVAANPRFAVPMIRWSAGKRTSTWPSGIRCRRRSPRRTIWARWRSYGEGRSS